jgi:hypothetical protein
MATGRIDPYDDPFTGGFKKLPTAAGETILGAAKSYTFGELRAALKKALKALGSDALPKMKDGKWGSPQRGDSKKGYRLDDQGHPNSPKPEEQGPHINWWDWSKGKRGSGGDSGAIPLKD